MPRHAAEIPGCLGEVRRCILGQDRPCKGACQGADHPAHNDGIADRNSQGAQKGDPSQYISKLSLSYVENLEDWLLKEIQVRVITADAEAHRLVLSAREILKEKEAEEKKALVSNVQVGLVTEGVVESVKDYGAFVRLSNGLTGLVHVSQISDKHIKNPRTVLNEGDTVKVKVIGIKDGKISLSMKALNDVASEEIQEEAVEIPQAEEIGSNLGALLKGFHFE